MKTFFSVLAAIIVAYLGFLFIEWVTGPSALEKQIARTELAVKAYNQARCQNAGYHRNCLDY